MKFGLSAGGSGSTTRPESLVRVAKTVETLGFESLWIHEHLGVFVLPLHNPRLDRFAEEIMARY